MPPKVYYATVPVICGPNKEKSMSAEVLSVKPSDAIELLTAVLPTKQPVMKLGAPGVGKSSIVRQVAKKLNVEFRDLRTTLLDPVDLRGLPKTENGKTVWCPPDFLPTEGEGILCLEELPQALPMVQNALFELVLDRRIGNYALPDGWMVMATGNRVEDRAGAGRTNTALNNRFLHVDLEISVDDWLEWALENNIAQEVRAFIRFRPALLFQFDPTTNPRAFASPRSWAAASRVLPNTPEHLLHKAIAGCVSAGPAAEFVAFRKLYHQLPDVDAVLKSPATSPIPSKEPAVLFALIGALVERCKADKSLAPNFAKYGMRLPDEFGMVAVRDAMSLDRALVLNHDVQKWIAKARDKGMFAA